MRHDDQVLAELQAQYDSLTAHITAIDRDLAMELDAQRRLVLTEKRSTLGVERQNVVDQRETLSASRSTIIDTRPTAANATRGGRIVEYDDLTRMIYEIRTDVAIMKRQFEDHLARCDSESAGFPTNFLTFIAVGGIITLLLLAFVVIRIGMPG